MNLGKREQIERVIYGIMQHLWRQGTPRPVGFLRRFCECDTEMLVQKGGETELCGTTEAGGNHRVKKHGRAGVVATSQQAEVVISTMNDHRLSLERLKERFQRNACQRIDEKIVLGNAYLDETKLVKIAMQTVRFSV